MLKNSIYQLFPLDAISVVARSRGTDLEINGLPRGFTPMNCEVLATGEERHGNMSRTHYLVEVDNHIVFLTICMPEYGDNMFALIRGSAQIDTEEADDVKKHAKTAISIVCRPPVQLRVA